MRRFLNPTVFVRIAGTVPRAASQVRDLRVMAPQFSGRPPKKLDPGVSGMLKESARRRREAKKGVQVKVVPTEDGLIKPAGPRTKLEDFHDSLKQGDFEKIRRYLASPDISEIINSKDSKGTSALYIVLSKVIEQYREYFFYDEKEGEFINRVDFTGKKNYPESWRRINQEFSALDILKDLLENGADPNLPEIFFKENPLVYTLKSSVPVAVDLLLKYGAKVSGKELVFIVSNRPDLDLLRRIFEENGADPNASDEYGVTPLIRAIECCQPRIIEDEVREINEERHERDLGLIKLLLEMGADPMQEWNLLKYQKMIRNIDVTDAEIKSQMSEGMDYGDLKRYIKYLAKRNGGRAVETPIDLAKNRGLDDVVEAFQGAIDTKKTYARTEISVKPEALRRAVEDGNYEAVRNLLELGADPHEPSQDDGLTPFDVVRNKIQSPPDNELYTKIANAIKESEARKFEKRLAGYKEGPRPSSSQVKTDTRRHLSTKAVSTSHILEMSEIIVKGLQEVIERGNIEAIVESEVSKNPTMKSKDDKEVIDRATDTNTKDDKRHVVNRVTEILSSANKEGSLVREILETVIEECFDSEDCKRLGDASRHTTPQYFNNIAQALEEGVKKRNHEYSQGYYDGLLKNGTMSMPVSEVEVLKMPEEEFLHRYEEVIIEALKNCVSIYATSLLRPELRPSANRKSLPLSTDYSGINGSQRRSLSSGPDSSFDQAKLDLEAAADLGYYDKNGLNSIAQRNGFTKLELLGYAVRHNSHSAVMSLMRRGSFRKLVNETLKDGKTPLQRAIDCGLSCGGVAHNLIKHSDPPIDLANDYGQEITSKLVKLRSLSTLVMALKMFNEDGGDIQSVGDNILFKMVSQGDSYDIAYYFLKKEVCSSCAVDCDGNSIVLKTIEAMKNTGPGDVDKSYKSFLNALLEDIDVEKYNYNGIYPLNYAVEKRNYPAVCALLERGAKTDILNESGNTVLDIALESVSGFDIVKRLIEAGAKRPSNSPEAVRDSDKVPLVGKKPLQK